MTIQIASVRRSALALGALVLGFGAAGVAPASAAACAPGDSAICFFLNDVKATPAQMGIPTTTASVRRETCEDWDTMLGARSEFRGLCSDPVDAPVSPPQITVTVVDVPVTVTEINLNDLLR